MRNQDQGIFIQNKKRGSNVPSSSVMESWFSHYREILCVIHERDSTFVVGEHEVFFLHYWDHGAKVVVPAMVSNNDMKLETCV